jgi:hypothetical protein
LNQPTHWSNIVDVELQYGGAFLANPVIKLKHISGILSIFGSLVTYKKGKHMGWMKKISEIMPAMIVQFTSQS